MPIPAWALTVASHSSIFGLAFATSPGVEKEVPTPLQVYRKELGSTGHNQSEFSQCLVELPNRSVPAHVLDLPCHSNFYFVVSDGTYLSKERGNSPPPPCWNRSFGHTWKSGKALNKGFFQKLKLIRPFWRNRFNPALEAIGAQRQMRLCTCVRKQIFAV